MSRKKENPNDIMGGLKLPCKFGAGKDCVFACDTGVDASICVDVHTLKGIYLDISIPSDLPTPRSVYLTTENAKALCSLLQRSLDFLSKPDIDTQR